MLYNLDIFDIQILFILVILFKNSFFSQYKIISAFLKIHVNNVILNKYDQLPNDRHFNSCNLLTWNNNIQRIIGGKMD